MVNYTTYCNSGTKTWLDHAPPPPRALYTSKCDPGTRNMTNV